MKEQSIKDKYWRVIYVKARSEKKIATRLNELGLENFVPKFREKRRWSDRYKWVEFPLLPGYVFVNVSDSDRDLVFRAEGVLNYLRYNNQDAKVSEYEIKVLEDIANKGYHVTGEFGNLNKGDCAKIAVGPFAGLTGRIVENTNQIKIKVLIVELDYTLTITLSKEQLIAI